jgi:hypothetical protein
MRETVGLLVLISYGYSSHLSYTIIACLASSAYSSFQGRVGFREHVPGNYGEPLRFP